MSGAMKVRHAKILGKHKEHCRIKIWTSPKNIQALSLYSLCQDTLSATPSWTSRSFSSLISFTLVKGLHKRQKSGQVSAAWPRAREHKTRGLVL